MIGFDEARRLALAGAQPLPSERVGLADCCGRVLGEDLHSPSDLPPFDNSAMDGFALPVGAEPMPIGCEFDIVASIAAGDDGSEARGACEIMTGAPMPPGLDAVLPVEQARVLSCDGQGRPTRIALLSAVEPGAHVRRRGSDVSAGQPVLPAGTVLDASARMLLAAMGVAEIGVRARLPAALICTGAELVDDPAQALRPGQIRNSNGPYLAQRLADIGAVLAHRETVADEAAAFLAALRRAQDAGARLVVSTGAVSMGRHDFVPEALRSIGAELVFHKIAMRPGKPLLHARLPDGSAYFGLPGNPISGAVGLRFFIEPWLRARQGRAPESSIRLPLAEPARKKAGFTMLQKARVFLDASGVARVRLLQGQESFRIQSLIAANAWAVLPVAAEALPAGMSIDVFGLEGEGIVLTADRPQGGTNAH
ncbi:molybdopterin molybdotransferase MoeA [Arenimonas sp.]|uniref:molybdopterin molybdotransferase MoeA n=1 Tax=Arenimonas sp. TaxID=1872635 RepID=UPI0039E3D1EC